METDRQKEKREMQGNGEGSKETSSLPPALSYPKRKRLRVILSFLLIAGAAAVTTAIGGVGYFLFVPPDRNGVAREFTIAPGESFLAVATSLEREGLVRSALAFSLFLRLEGKETEVKAGTFSLSPAMTPRRIAEILTAKAPPERDVSVTIPEGFTVWEIADRLNGAGIIEDRDAFLNATVRIPPYSFLPCAEASGTTSCVVAVRDLEGFLFPDTYRFRKHTTPEEIVAKFLENFDEKFTEDLRREVQEGGRSLRDVVILASLVEEEAKHDEDRPRIAGILLKRLTIGMPLQVDATVLYAKAFAQGGSGLSDRVLTAEDLALDSPYNTYLHAGLPPGPIANPGLKSLLAALRPEPSPYLYYLHAPDGTTIYSRTLDEHNRAKAEFLH
jgi:UPF0755 protein